MSIFDEISQKLQRADGEAVAALVHSAAAEYPPADILSKGLLSGMNTVGEKFRKKRDFRSRGFACLPRDESGLGCSAPVFPCRQYSVARHGGARNGKGRFSRHRQGARENNARGQGTARHRPRHGCAGGNFCPRGKGKLGAGDMLFLPALLRRRRGAENHCPMQKGRHTG